MLSYIKNRVSKVAQDNRVVINDYVIERYVRFRDSLDKATLLVAGEYINEYASGGAIETFYRTFYEEYERVERVLSPKVRAFTASLFE